MARKPRITVSKGDAKVVVKANTHAEALSIAHCWLKPTIGSECKTKPTSYCRVPITWRYEFGGWVRL